MPINATYIPTPAEQEALAYHRRNLESGNYLRNPDGSLTTFYGTVIGDDKGSMLIPTYWHGQIRDVPEAMDFAIKSGIKFPRYKDTAAALAAERALHDIMAAETAAYAKRKALK